MMALSHSQWLSAALTIHASFGKVESDTSQIWLRKDGNMRTIRRPYQASEPELVDVQRIVVPDLWHLAMALRDQGNTQEAEQVLECWHLCHDLLADARAS